MAYATLVLDLPTRLIATLRDEVDRDDKREALRAFIREAQALLSGSRKGMARLNLASVTASQTVACARAAAVADTDTLVIGGTTLTSRATQTNESAVVIPATDALYAAALAAIINAHSVLSKIVFARVTASATVTIYSKFPGPIGNLITLVETGNGYTVGGAALANGAADEMDDLQLGYDPVDP